MNKTAELRPSKVSAITDCLCHMEEIISRLESLADELVTEPGPTTQATGGPPPRQVVSLAQLLDRLPDELGNLTSRVDTAIGRLRGGLV